MSTGFTLGTIHEMFTVRPTIMRKNNSTGSFIDDGRFNKIATAIESGKHIYHIVTIAVDMATISYIF